MHLYTPMLEGRDMPSNATTVGGVKSNDSGNLQSHTIVGIGISLGAHYVFKSSLMIA